MVREVTHAGWRWVTGRRLAVFATATAIVSALLYSAWVAGPWLNPGLDPVTAYVSELAASGQPHAILYQSFDGLSGLSLLAASAAVILHDRRAGWRRWGPFALLGGFGLVTFTDSLLPLSCTPTADVVCAVEEGLGLVPIAHQLHLYSSSLAGAFAAGAVIWVTYMVWRRGGTPLLARVGAVLAILHLFTLGYTLLEIGHLALGGLGLAQRVCLATLAAWWLVLFLDWFRHCGRGVPSW